MDSLLSLSLSLCSIILIRNKNITSNDNGKNATMPRAEKTQHKGREKEHLKIMTWQIKTAIKMSNWLIKLDLLFFIYEKRNNNEQTGRKFPNVKTGQNCLAEAQSYYSGQTWKMSEKQWLTLSQQDIPVHLKAMVKCYGDHIASISGYKCLHHVNAPTTLSQQSD